MSAEAKQFRKQFDDKDWNKCMADPSFKGVVDAGDYVKAGELFPVILIGAAKTKKEAKHLNKEHKTDKVLDQLLDELESPKKNKLGT